MFSGGCFPADHSSGYTSINYQVAINYIKTVKSKPTFERDSQSHEVVIKGYHTDNGISDASYFMEELLNNQKKIRFSGTGASHQNGAVERAIKMVSHYDKNHVGTRCAYMS